MTVRAKTTPASTAGSFASHQRSEPESTLTPRQLGALGLGPSSASIYMDRLDTTYERGTRPARPYLPLSPADDDEFFDAPTGSVLITRGPDGRVASKHRNTGGDEWRELSERGVEARTPVSAGELWATRFSEQDGTMSPSVLVAPHGMLYSDQDRFIARREIDDEIGMEHAVAHFGFTGGRATVVARHVFGDEPGGTPGVRAAAYDEEVVVAFQGDKVVVGGVSTHQAFDPSTAKAYDRDGQIVLRKETDEDWGYELALLPRVTRD